MQSSQTPRPARLAPEAPAYPRNLESCPDLGLSGGSYHARFALSQADLEAVQRLRFQVFNLELHEGLDESYETGLDRDRYDLHCHHLMVIHKPSNTVVGTYRVQTSEMAAKGVGFYTGDEFNLAQFPDELIERSVETGRACVAADHRNGRVINLLWKGLASYVCWNDKTILFGCCSLTSQSPHVARHTYDFLAQGRFLHSTYRVEPQPDYVAYGPDFLPDVDVTVKLPALFAGYLKLGAKVTGPPALDRMFKTIDFLTLVDLRELEPQVRHTFFRHVDEKAGG